MTHFLKNPNKSAPITKLLLADPCLFGRDEFKDHLIPVTFAGSRIDISREEVSVMVTNEYRDDDGEMYEEDEQETIEVLLFTSNRHYDADDVVNLGELLPLDIGVDSGQVGAMIEGTPWVFGEFDFDIEIPPVTISNDYAMCCFLTLHGDAGTWRDNTCFASRTAYGDGTCRIWVLRDAPDQPIKAMVVELC